MKVRRLILKQEVMILNKETVYSVDKENKKIRTVREFNAPVEKVWKAWTEKDLLDQWWAPKPWKAFTQSMDFREGGTWLYYMQGPDGSKHYCRNDYETIDSGRSFESLDTFCDKDGAINTEMPRMHWRVLFVSSEAGTKVEVEITFPSIEDLDKIAEMGFKEGFAMAHNNLDELLAI